jgi:acetone carboxylase gamma subunit
MNRLSADQAKDLEQAAREQDAHICECGHSLSDHEWPMGGCPETGCTAFRERGTCAGCRELFPMSLLSDLGDGWLGLKVCPKCRPVADGLMRSPERVERLLDTLSPSEALAVGLELGYTGI